MTEPGPAVQTWARSLLSHASSRALPLVPRRRGRWGWGHRTLWGQATRFQTWPLVLGRSVTLGSCHMPLGRSPEGAGGGVSVVLQPDQCEDRQEAPQSPAPRPARGAGLSPGCGHHCHHGEVCRDAVAWAHRRAGRRQLRSVGASLTLCLVEPGHRELSGGAPGPSVPLVPMAGPSGRSHVGRSPLQVAVSLGLPCAPCGQTLAPAHRSMSVKRGRVPPRGQENPTLLPRAPVPVTPCHLRLPWRHRPPPPAPLFPPQRPWGQGRTVATLSAA